MNMKSCPRAKTIHDLDQGEEKILVQPQIMPPIIAAKTPRPMLAGPEASCQGSSVPLAYEERRTEKAVSLRHQAAPLTCSMARDWKMLYIAMPETTSTPAAAISIDGMLFCTP